MGRKESDTTEAVNNKDNPVFFPVTSYSSPSGIIDDDGANVPRQNTV